MNSKKLIHLIAKRFMYRHSRSTRAWTAASSWSLLNNGYLFKHFIKCRSPNWQPGLHLSCNPLAEVSSRHCSNRSKLWAHYFESLSCSQSSPKFSSIFYCWFCLQVYWWDLWSCDRELDGFWGREHFVLWQVGRWDCILRFSWDKFHDSWSQFFHKKAYKHFSFFDFQNNQSINFLNWLQC